MVERSRIRRRISAEACELPEESTSGGASPVCTRCTRRRGIGIPARPPVHTDFTTLHASGLVVSDLTPHAAATKTALVNRHSSGAIMATGNPAKYRNCRPIVLGSTYSGERKPVTGCIALRLPQRLVWKNLLPTTWFRPARRWRFRDNWQWRSCGLFEHLIFTHAHAAPACFGSIARSPQAAYNRAE